MRSFLLRVILSGGEAGVEGSHAAQRSVCHPERSGGTPRSRRILKTRYPFQRNVMNKQGIYSKKAYSSPLCIIAVFCEAWAGNSRSKSDLSLICTPFSLRTFPFTRTLPSGSFDSASFARSAQDDNVNASDQVSAEKQTAATRSVRRAKPGLSFRGPANAPTRNPTPNAGRRASPLSSYRVTAEVKLRGRLKSPLRPLRNAPSNAKRSRQQNKAFFTKRRRKRTP